MSRKKTVKSESDTKVNEFETIEKMYSSCKDKNLILYPFKINDNEEITINIEYSISAIKVLSLVNAVVEASFNKLGEYTPFTQNVAFKKYIIEFYSEIKLPSDVDTYYPYVMETGLFDIIIRSINKTQYKDICNMINDAIDFKKQQILIEKKEEQDEMEKRAIYSIFDSVADFKQLLKQIKGIVEKIDPNSEEFKEIFKIAKELNSKKGLTEKELVKELLKEKTTKEDNKEIKDKKDKE